ncbi:TPA: type VI secretion protein VasK, partial [Klebsiella pneumoniae]|nr:type VI secretion protein VasK [Klebsiella pneumoniae]
MDNVNKPAAISVAATVIVCIAAVTLLVLLGGLAWWLWAMDRATQWETLRPLIATGFIIWGMALSLLVLGFMAFRLLIKDKVKPSAAPVRQPTRPAGGEALYAPLKKHLHARYRLHWRRKVRLLLVTGDEAAIEQLVPGLRQQRWLEGQRTVLIYGGSLLSEPDSEQYAALRKLRHGRPLDGIVRVMPSSLTLTPQISESDLRGLEKISELLGYAAPVWLWKLCDSEWPQADRAEQAVGVSFPLRATEEDVARQLAQMLPTLREQGMHQIAADTRHDFLLRLGQQLIDGEIAQWRRQLAPWLTASRQRLALRGLMFSLPEPRTVDPYQEADALPASQPHLLTLPATWQGIV